MKYSLILLSVFSLFFSTAFASEISASDTVSQKMKNEVGLLMIEHYGINDNKAYMLGDDINAAYINKASLDELLIALKKSLNEVKNHFQSVLYYSLVKLKKVETQIDLDELVYSFTLKKNVNSEAFQNEYVSLLNQKTELPTEKTAEEVRIQEPTSVSVQQTEDVLEAEATSVFDSPAFLKNLLAFSVFQIIGLSIIVIFFLVRTLVNKL